MSELLIRTPRVAMLCTDLPLLCWHLTLLLLAPALAPGQMTDSEHSGVVELHNRLRISVQPEAANMNLLVASANLRTLAQQAADSCRFEHNYGGAYSGLGENLYLGGSNSSLAVMLWFIERENYRLTGSVGECGLAYGNGRYPQYAAACGHYYQVVQASVGEVGCGKKACSGNVLIVCEYNSGASSPPYTAGAACSSCGSTRPRCLDGLCVPVGTSGSTCSLACTSCTKLVGAGSSAADSCDCSGAYTPCTKCDSDAKQCLNNSTDIGASLTNCTCACPADFYGDQCQYNRAQFASALQLRFGGELRSRSYFPVPKSFWPSLWRALESPLLSVIADFCRWNFTVCCPSVNSTSDTSGNASILASGDLDLAASGINVTATGELAVSLVALSSATAGFCGGAVSAGYASFLASDALIANLTAQRESLLASATLACCGVNLTRVASGLDQSLYWPEGQGAGGGGGGGGGSSGGGGEGGASLGLSLGEPLNSAGAALLAVSCIGAIAAAAATVVLRLVKGPPDVVKISSISGSGAATEQPQQTAAANKPTAPPTTNHQANETSNPTVLVERL